MASGRDFSRSQKKIIDRYYDNHGTILAQRLAEITTDMALADGDEKKLTRLWIRAEQALTKAKGAGLKVTETEIKVVLEKRDLESLGRLVSKLA
ncbi:MAG: hypothetical protein ACI89L_001360 [Phycisphaerales bacterium]|jgi:hypothetical protein